MSEVIMVYDSSRNTGHHLDYIIPLLKETKSNKYNTKKYYFVLHPEMEKVLDESLYNSSNSKVFYIEGDQIARFESQNLFFRTIGELRYINSLCREYCIRRLLFLMLDHYQIAIGICNKMLNDIAVEGIFFKPYTRLYIKRNGIVTYLKDLAFYTYKRIMFNLMLRNKNIKKIWILNDTVTVETLNKLHEGKKFYFLPDPVKEFNVGIGENCLSTYKINPKNKILVVFGSISPFKNLENIIAALSAITNLGLTLLILGRWLSRDYKREIDCLIQEILENKPDFEILVEDRFFSEEEIDSCIAASDIVLIPYIDFYYSSGVLGRAAGLGKPVIGPYNTLVADLVDKYSLGVAVDPSNPDKIAEGIKYLLDLPPNYPRNGMQEYVSSRTYDEFVSLLLDIEYS